MTFIKRAWLLYAGAFFFAFIQAGCSLTPVQTNRLLLNPPPDLPRRAEIDDVPFFPQERFQCGPSALATVLQFRGLAVTPADLKSQIYVPDKEGSFQAEVLAAARAHNMLAIQLEPDLSALLKEIAHGNPVLVFQNLGLDFWTKWHFAVAVGYDLEQQEIVLRSGIDRRHVNPFSTFERTWKRGQYWGLVIVPADKIPVTSTPLAFLKAASELESLGHLDTALAAYGSAITHWPENIIARLGKGNIHYRLNNYIAAEKTFRDALSIQSSNSQVWNNLSYSLAAKGCHDQAKAAIDCAMSLAPDNREIIESQKEIHAMGTAESQCEDINCPVP